MKPQPSKTPQEVFESKRADALATVVFPQDKLPEDFKEVLHKALVHCSIRQVQCHITTWINYVRFDRIFLWGEINLAVEILKGSTPTEMGMTLVEHLELLTEYIYPIQKELERIDEEICEPIAKEVNAMVKLSNRAPLGKEIIKTSK